jgi:flagellar biosynthesis protein FlhG
MQMQTTAAFVPETGAQTPIAPVSCPATPRVWAVGGGKGGVGKSVVTSSLAAALAVLGPRCALIDADLGGANLHTLLGAPRPEYTLNDFLTGRVKQLSDVLSRTAIPGLTLASGARAVLEIANPKHAQKQKLLRHLRRLDVEHVFVDLGAGTSFNVLDPFVWADERVIVVSPEPTSIENAYHFLKAAFFRSLREMARGPHRDVLHEVMDSARREGLSPRKMVDLASQRDAAVGRELRQRVRVFAPKLIVNQVAGAEHRRIGHEMVAAARRHLGATLHYVGAIDLDAAVPAAVSRQQPVLHLFPGCAFAEGVRAVVERIRADQSLGPDRAPPRFCVSAAAPPLATHGIASQAVALPKLPTRQVAAPSKLPALDLGWPGRSLRNCREHLGLSLGELEERTRIRHLHLIEAERYADLPPEPYLQAHVRSYAEALGIRDAELLAARYAQAAQEIRPERPVGLLARLREYPGIGILPRRASS